MPTMRIAMELATPKRRAPHDQRSEELMARVVRRQPPPNGMRLSSAAELACSQTEDYLEKPWRRQLQPRVRPQHRLVARSAVVQRSTLRRRNPVEDRRCRSRAHPKWDLRSLL